MELFNLLPVIYARFAVFALIFLRISTLLWTFNLFRQELITGRIMYTLACVLAVYVMFLNQDTALHYDIFSMRMLLCGVFQVFIGFLGGLILNTVFDIFLCVGQIISTQIGLSMASMIDPRLGTITTLAHFYLTTASLIFLSLNGHLYVIKTLINSFDILPLNKQFMPQSMMQDVISYTSTIFSGGIILTITIVLTMLLTNIALAVMTKFAPQFNIYSIGTNITLIMGLLCLYLSYNAFTGEGQGVIENGLTFFQNSYLKLKLHV